MKNCIKMSGSYMSSEERNKLSRLTQILSQTVIQIIVQSRLGEKVKTYSKTPDHGSHWFNLNIEDTHDTYQEAKKALSGHKLDFDSPLSIEILLQTPEAEIMVLEIWTLSIVDVFDSTVVAIYPTIYDRMTVLLKALLSVTRITPSYKLSFRQSVDSFVMCYRINMEEPNYDALGDDPVRARIGQVNTPLYSLLLNVSYRTNLALPPPSKTSHDIMLKSDHFKSDSSPRFCRRIYDRNTDSSETTQTSDDSQEAAKVITVPVPTGPTSRSRSASESSGRGVKIGSQQVSPVEVSAAFVDKKVVGVPNPDEFVMPDIPFSELISNESDTSEPEKEKCNLAHQDADKNPLDAETKAKEVVQSDLPKSATSLNLKEESGFVMVDLKTPFVGQSEGTASLVAFYRESQLAPPLRLFSEETSNDISTVTEQLQSFEANMSDYEELVRSLDSDTTSSLG